MAFVNFHQELTEGEKRGLPRATRFVYMELSLKARPLRGVIPLARGMTDLHAVWDILGGSKNEIKSALSMLTRGSDPLVKFENVGDLRTLVVVAWCRWNRNDKSTARVLRFRGKEKANDYEGNDDIETLDETVVKRVSAGNETQLKRSVDKRREEEKRGDCAPAFHEGDEEPPPEPVPDPEDAPRPTPEERYRAKYVAGVKRVRGSFVFDDMQQGLLNQTIIEYAKGSEGKALRGKILEAWIEDRVAEFTAFASAEDPKFWSGFQPKGFVRWLNEKCAAPPERAEWKPERDSGEQITAAEFERRTGNKLPLFSGLGGGR